MLRSRCFFFCVHFFLFGFFFKQKTAYGRRIGDWISDVCSSYLSIPEFLYDAPTQMADLLHRMWPISWRSFPGSIQQALIETLHMATMGTILAIIMAVPVGVAVANNLTPNGTITFIARFILVSSRSINPLVGALLFIVIFVPCPFVVTILAAFLLIS